MTRTHKPRLAAVELRSAGYLPLALLLLSSSAFGRPQWSATTIAPNAWGTSSLVAFDSGDIDGDGDVDLVASAASSGDLQWFRQLSPGQPWEPRGFGLPDLDGILWIDAADMDQDSDLDVLCAGPNFIGWLENDGSGTFAVSHALPLLSFQGQGGQWIEAVDLDADGALDVVAGTDSGSGDFFVQTFMNVGGALQSGAIVESYSVGVPHLADLDLDGDLDLLVPDSTTIYGNDGAGGFSGMSSFAGARFPLATDLDDDGDVDLLSISGSSIGWSEFNGAAYGARQVLVQHPQPVGNMFIYAAEIADLNGDGQPDVAVSIRPSNTNSADTRTRTAWFPSGGDGTLGTRVDLGNAGVISAALGFGIGDADRDGDLDVFSCESSGAGLSIELYRNEATFGSSFCPGVVNGTGSSGLLEATGSILVELNQLTLRASQLPAQQFGLLVVADASITPTPIPGNLSSLCLGGQVGRFVGQIQAASPSGVALTSVDLNSVPTPNGSEAITPGMTRYFTFWHRDVNPGPSNLTNSLAITFQ